MIRWASELRFYYICVWTSTSPFFAGIEAAFIERKAQPKEFTEIFKSNAEQTSHYSENVRDLNVQQSRSFFWSADFG